MSKYYQPTSDVISMVEATILKYHHHLEDARIGVLFRDEAPASGENYTLGMAKKVSPEAQAAGLKYDFIINVYPSGWETHLVYGWEERPPL